MRRSNGTGYVFKRNKTYHIRFYVNGKFIEKSLKVTDKKEAEERAKEYLSIVNAKSKEEIAFHVGEARNLLKKKNQILISNAWDTYLHSPSRPDSSKGTLRGYKSTFNDFTAWIKETFPCVQNFSGISNEIASGYAKYLWGKRKVSERTYNPKKSS